MNGNNSLPKVAQIGRDVIIREWVVLVRPENIAIGNHVMIDSFVVLAGGRDHLTEISDHVHIGSFTNIDGGGGTTIKDFVGISSGCRFFSSNDDYIDGGLSNPTVPLEFRNVKTAHITLERFVLLGANVVILPGVTIGEGATVGACSVVKNDLLPWTVNAGIPARAMKRRNRNEVIRRFDNLMERELVNG